MDFRSWISQDAVLNEVVGVRFRESNGINARQVGRMTLAINIFLHVLLIGSMLAFLAFTVGDALAETDRQERIKRFMAMAAGALIAIGANQAGVGYADFTAQSLAGARAPSAGAAVVAAIVPALLGAGVGFLIVRLMNAGDKRGLRLTGFVAVLASVAFALVYAQVTQSKGVILGVAALPNLAFVVGVMLTYVFSGENKEGRDASVIADAARSLWKSRRGGTAGAADSDLRIARKDEFDGLS